MSKRCAYCDQPGKLTREHVWPKCFMEREGHEAAHFSVVTQSVHKADYVVKDVCQQCNSKLLAPLDAYFCELYDRYFVEPRDFDSTVVFRFDSDRLTRALLKIAYNTARGGYKDVGPFLPMRKYLLGLEPRPTQLAVFLVLLSPSLAPSKTDPGVQIKVMPQSYWSWITELPTSNGSRVLTRLGSVNTKGNL